jgi:hypothetical protein
MPSRLLREGILDSEAVCSLSFPAEVLYRRLMSVVDDFGRFDGRPSVLRGRLYPLQIDKVREADITRWIAECEKAGLIALYSVSGKQYILFRKLGSPRSKESKWPPPPPEVEGTAQHASVNACARPFTDENGRAQAFTDAPGSGSGSDTGSGSGSGKDSGETAPPSSPPPVPPPDNAVLTYPTVGKGPREWHLLAPHLAELVECYPGLDVLAECRKALAWCQANRRKRKTADGMPAFLVNWLNNGTARGGGRPPPDPAARPQPESVRAKLERIQAEMDAKGGAGD